MESAPTVDQQSGPGQPSPGTVGAGASPVRQTGGVVAQTAILTSVQILSPAAGLLAEIVLAWRFGASGVVDAYRLTVLLLVYGQQFFVSHILPFVIVPIFAECRAKNREQDAWAMADAIGWVLAFFGSLIAAA